MASNMASNIASDPPPVLCPARTLTAHPPLPLPHRRHTHSTLCTFHAPLPACISPVFIAPSFLETSLTGYIHSDQAASTRFFCKTCGCHIGDRGREAPADGTTPAWRAATSIFDTHAASIFDIRTHVFTPRCANPLAARSKLDRAISPRPRPRPRPRPPQLSAWNAPVDMSDASRLVSGADAVAWASVPRAALEPAVPADLRFGSLVPYESPYEDGRRAFCGVCGATVFYYGGGGDVNTVRVAVGILRVPDGVLALD
ncbi:DUF636 domain protein [Lasiosphaeria ovina]|uniref:DUF636 domain protein n=1 Tax=Lasiosphaeria ovina TaxID=92902 RepID=A0AAE0JT25_9PEZI|nr:DUF636 domain protein [Lasiosphaeria ovina]